MLPDLYITGSKFNVIFLQWLLLFYEEIWHLVSFFNNSFYNFGIIECVGEYSPLDSALKEFLYCERPIPKCVVEILKLIGIVMHLWEDSNLLRQIFKYN